MPPKAQRARHTAEPGAADRRRYHAFKSGMIVADIAAQEGVKESTVEESIRKVRADNQRYSGEETAIQVRKILLQHLPQVSEALSRGMTATKLVTRQVVALDSLTGNAVQLQESIREADHDTQLKAVNEWRGVAVAVQPREPLVSIDQRSQTNIMNTATPVTPNSLTSPEAVIRAIRAQRGLALADGVQAATIDAVVAHATDAEDAEGDEDGDELDEDEDSEDEDGE
jgi:hypothetical protein